MNLKKISLIFSLAIFYLPAHGMVEFIKKATGHQTEYRPIVTHDFDAPIPEKIKKVLDANLKEMRNFFCSPVMPGWLPGWWIKPSDSNYARIRDAKKFAQAINVLNCDRIKLPLKYKYQSPKGHHWVIAQSVPDYIDKDESFPSACCLQIFPLNKITLLDETDIAQLYEIAHRLRWHDFRASNIIKTPTHGVYIVDTELTSPNRDIIQFDRNLKGISLRLAIVNKMLKDYIINVNCTQKAHDFLRNEKNRLLNKPMISKSSESFYLRLLKPFTKNNPQLINKVKSINHFNNFSPAREQKSLIYKIFSFLERK